MLCCRTSSAMILSPLLLWYIAAATTTTTTTTTTTSSPTTLRRVCYYTNWAQYRKGPAKFTAANISPNLCSHIHFAFAKLVNNRLAPIEHNDVFMYQQISHLKTRTRPIKFILTIGGFNAGSSPFRRIVSSQRSRKEFVSRVVSYLRRYHFDGLDIDWEYPTAVDRGKFVKLAWELRKAFDKEGKGNRNQSPLLLSCAVPAGKTKIDAGFDVAKLARVMDYITVMAYDYHGPWDNVIGMNTPLFPASYERMPFQRQLNVAWTMQYWASKGAPREKLNLGIATYGRGFQLANPAKYLPGSKAKGSSRPGRFTNEPGFLAYFEFCRHRNKATSHWMSDSKVPYLVVGDQWIGFDDQKSLKLKVEWMKKMGFGGVSVWSLDLDDFNGLCGEGYYPLLTQINQTLMGSNNNGTSPAQPLI